MFDNPEVTRQLMDDRLDRWQREAAAHRVSGRVPGAARRRLRDRFRASRASLFSRRRPTARGAEPATT